MNRCPFEDKPIMASTYNVLCDEGYAALSISKIAEELGKSKSLIYYHYDDKHDVITSFLSLLRDELSLFLNDLPNDPEDKLDAILHKFLAPSKEIRSLRTALLELKAETPFDDAIAKEFKQFDELIRQRVTTILSALDVEEAEKKSIILVSTIDGMLDRELGYTGNVRAKETIQTLKSTIL